MSRFAILALFNLVGTLALCPSLSAQPALPESGPIRWIDNPQVALQQHLQEPRPLVVYASASFCTYCVKMERETWANPAVAARIRQGYRTLKVSADVYGDFVDRLGVQGFPTTIVFASEGHRIATLPGYVDAATLLQSLPAIPSPAVPAAAAPSAPAPGSSAPSVPASTAAAAPISAAAPNSPVAPAAAAGERGSL